MSFITRDEREAALGTCPMRPELPPLPPRMAKLPIDARGYPVPFFVAWVNGVPDHRVADASRRRECIQFRVCWLCGEQLGRFTSFVIGPMCSINLVSADPPMHRDCAEYALKACPFLTRPEMRRRENGMPEGAKNPAGEMIRRNPGVMLLWTSRDSGTFSDGSGGVLFHIGSPSEPPRWFSEGREATREEVLASFESGCPILREMAEKDGPNAVALFEREKARAMHWVPR
jgi:hypothetical protein